MSPKRKNRPRWAIMVCPRTTPARSRSALTIMYSNLSGTHTTAARVNPGAGRHCQNEDDPVTSRRVLHAHLDAGEMTADVRRLHVMKRNDQSVAGDSDNLA
jgi:hypothetical protein